ncbi:hypothetical protein RFI_27034 [Reticulomyxa filosa]|uniref:Uncharacterized protein n=1 Tax=Reticulomyxa filosa TaxID=46433 RepID=X6M8M6_RETFI|nr:hypothetical protein RFI_27034 [Reticulomyxa filosa]|eukprot:ETO10343.1 hypothetical protein RFI_27034 [Reticulomyxa filosa]
MSIIKWLKLSHVGYLSYVNSFIVYFLNLENSKTKGYLFQFQFFVLLIMHEYHPWPENYKIFWPSYCYGLVWLCRCIYKIMNNPNLFFQQLNRKAVGYALETHKLQQKMTTEIVDPEIKEKINKHNTKSDKIKVELLFQLKKESRFFVVNVSQKNLVKMYEFESACQKEFSFFDWSKEQDQSSNGLQQKANCLFFYNTKHVHRKNSNKQNYHGSGLRTKHFGRVFIELAKTNKQPFDICIYICFSQDVLIHKKIMLNYITVT